MRFSNGQALCKRCDNSQASDIQFTNPLTMVRNFTKSVPRKLKIISLVGFFVVLLLIAGLLVLFNNATANKDWGNEHIPGTNYTVSLSIRYYYYKLLYRINITPYDGEAFDFARTLSIELIDKDGHAFKRINPGNDWRQIVDTSGDPIGLNREGSSLLLIKNYFEISEWRPVWRNY
jgi:hypothetical protein